jgi:hypothetical protein
MKLGDILKTVGSGLIQTLLPGTGSLIVAGINEFLPGDKQLPESATTEQASSALNSLPPEQRASLLEKEYDVKMEAYSTLQVMLQANSQSKHTTRPKIAYQAWQVVAAITLAFAFGWLYAVLTGDVEMVRTIENSYMFAGMLIAPLVVWLNAYFGILRDEAKDKMNSAQGHKVDPVTGLIGKLFKK